MSNNLNPPCSEINPLKLTYKDTGKSILKRKIDSDTHSTSLTTPKRILRPTEENCVYSNCLMNRTKEIPLSDMEKNDSEMMILLSTEQKYAEYGIITNTKPEFELDSLFLDNEGEKNNMKINKDAIKRRRSSFGNYLTLSKKPDQDSLAETECPSNAETCLSEEKDDDNIVCESQKNHLSKPVTQNADGPEESDLNEDANVDVQTLKTPAQKVLSAKVKAYQEKSTDLENEYKKWKIILKQQKQKVLECKRELREAENGETVIEEDDVLPHLNKEQRAILSSRPDYGRYLQQIKYARETLALTQMEVQKVSLVYKSHLESDKLLSNACYNIYEKSVVGETNQRNPKLLMKAMLRANEEKSV